MLQGKNIIKRTMHNTAYDQNFAWRFGLGQIQPFSG